MTREPTTRQLEIVAFMLAYQEEHGMPATVREICEHFHWSSTNAAVEHLKYLAKKGLVIHHAGKARGWVAAPPQEEA
jgi:repressor LexA